MNTKDYEDRIYDRSKNIFKREFANLTLQSYAISHLPRQAYALMIEADRQDMFNLIPEHVIDNFSMNGLWKR